MCISNIQVIIITPVPAHNMHMYSACVCVVCVCVLVRMHVCVCVCENSWQLSTCTATSQLVCDYPGCNFEAINRAGLTNHQCQKHTLAIIVQCDHCGKPLSCQRFHNHKQFCSRRPPQRPVSLAPPPGDIGVQAV